MKHIKHTTRPRTFYGAVQKFVARTNSTKLFYLSVGLLALSVVTLGSAIVIQQQTPAIATAPIPVSGYQVGTPVTMGLATMEMTNISFSNGQPGFKAPANAHYVIIDFTVKNNADRPIDVLPSNDTYLKNQAGMVSYLTPYGLKQPFRAGALLPGEQVKGQLSYLVEKTGSVKLFVDSIWSGGVVPFKVQ